MRLQPNRFGLAEGLVGLGVSFVAAGLAVSAFGFASGHARHPGTFGSDVVSLIAYWACWSGAAWYATGLARRRLPVAASPTGAVERPAAPAGHARPARARAVAQPAPAPAAPPAPGGVRALLARLRADYGLELRLWPDVPLGAAIGLASQYLLVPAIEAPLVPFVPHLYQRLGGPAHQLAGGVSDTASLVVLGALVCLGSPLFEELFFRGLLLRGLAGRLEGLAPALRAVVSVVAVALLFGLAHFEPLQFLGLAGFGVVLGTLAWRSGRLGPGIVAHVAFNAVAFVGLALSR